MEKKNCNHKRFFWNLSIYFLGIFSLFSRISSSFLTVHSTDEIVKQTISCARAYFFRSFYLFYDFVSNFYDVCQLVASSFDDVGFSVRRFSSSYSPSQEASSIRKLFCVMWRLENGLCQRRCSRRRNAHAYTSRRAGRKDFRIAINNNIILITI